jgi:hypothetical protein
VITDHIFRPYNYTGTGEGGGIGKGMCGWLGTCNRPAGDHRAARNPRSLLDDDTRKRIAQEYADGESPRVLAAKYPISRTGVRYVVIREGGTMRPPSRGRGRS